MEKTEKQGLGLIAAVVIFTVISMTVMILFFINRDVQAETLALTDADTPDGYSELDSGLPVQGEDGTDYLYIPLDRNVSEEDITVSANVLAGDINISVQGTTESFYYRNPLKGSSSGISDLSYGFSDGSANIHIVLDGIYETETIFKDGFMCLKFVRPDMEFKHVFVIDAGHGGKESGTAAYGYTEKDVTLAVSEQLQKLFDGCSDKNIKAYFTRTDDKYIDDAERLRIINGTGAEMAVSLHTGADPDTRVTNGISVVCSNSSSEKTAEIFEQKLTGITGLEDKGVESRSDIDILNKAEVPIYMVRLGYLTNKAEAEKISDPDYSLKAAEAIYEAILEECRNE